MYAIDRFECGREGTSGMNCRSLALWAPLREASLGSSKDDSHGGLNERVDIDLSVHQPMGGQCE